MGLFKVNSTYQSNFQCGPMINQNVNTEACTGFFFIWGRFFAPWAEKYDISKAERSVGICPLCPPFPRELLSSVTEAYYEIYYFVYQ